MGTPTQSDAADEQSPGAPETLPGEALVCPQCGRHFECSDQNSVGPADSSLPRCPEHGLAFVPDGEVDRDKPDPLLGQQVAGRFTVLGKLGSGAMGAVYRARQEAMGRDVALKILRPERGGDAQARARFEREARATSALVSPHTITVFDFGAAEDGSWFLAMELLHGETLGARLRRVGRLGAEEAIRITREALKSLAEAHAKGIIHRDMKPDNLFLVTTPDEGGNLGGEVCKLLDFGIAKVVRDAPRVDELETQAGAVFGTPRYMSPEQAQGMPLDARSDLYSLSVILYAMLTGRAPFTDDDAVVVMASHITREPPPFLDVAPDLERLPMLEALVEMGLKKSPEQRPQTAESYITLLDEAAFELALPPSRRAAAVAVGAESAPGPRGGLAGRPRMLAVFGLAFCALAAVAFATMRLRTGVMPPRLRPVSASLAERAGELSEWLSEAIRQGNVQGAGDRATNSGGASRAVPPRGSARPRRSVVRGLRRVPGDRYGRFE